MPSLRLRALTLGLALAGASLAQADKLELDQQTRALAREALRDPGNRAVTYAVIGDTPYGADQIADFPAFIADLNADTDVERVLHVGDIKNGSSRCDDSYFAWVADRFATLADPLVYTPGDNEWTDCHRSNNGKYDPLERLAALRDIFFAEPHVTLGGERRPLLSQAAMPGFEDIPENVLWMQARVLFSAVHVVGSRNNLAPWFGDDTADALEDDPERRLAEVEHRTAAAIGWLELSFALAHKTNAKAVLVLMQADTWPGNPDDGFSAILSTLAELSQRFGKPVLVVQGDSHVYRVDQPLLEGDPDHGITLSVPRLTRLVVEGATTSEWLKLTIDPRTPSVFSWQRVMR